jgi:signal peptide peptidase SppA
MEKQERSFEEGVEKVRKLGFLRKFFGRMRRKSGVVAVVPLHGVIGSGGILPLGRGPSLSMQGLEDRLLEAFTLKNVKSVVLWVNSPGGSPVQSAQIASRIRDLAKEHKVKVLTFCEDVAASGGYWLACAGDKIYADKASIVGSIGVVSSGFGFEEMIAKLGVERRVITSGTNKSRLDPFEALKEDDVKHIKGLQKGIHDQFIAYVKDRRGDSLKGSAKKMFSGDFWTGEEALKMGLVDEIGHMHETCRRLYGKKVKFRVMKDKKGFVSNLLSGSFMAPENWVEAFSVKLREMSFWQRYGL